MPACILSYRAQPPPAVICPRTLCPSRTLVDLIIIFLFISIWGPIGIARARRSSTPTRDSDYKPSCVRSLPGVACLSSSSRSIHLPFHLSLLPVSWIWPIFCRALPRPASRIPRPMASGKRLSRRRSRSRNARCRRFRRCWRTQMDTQPVSFTLRTCHPDQHILTAIKNVNVLAHRRAPATPATTFVSPQHHHCVLAPAPDSTADTLTRPLSP